MRGLVHGGVHHADPLPGHLPRAGTAARLCCRWLSCSYLRSLLVWLAHCRARSLPTDDGRLLLVQFLTHLKIVWQRLLQHPRSTLFSSVQTGNKLGWHIYVVGAHRPCANIWFKIYWLYQPLASSCEHLVADIRASGDDIHTQVRSAAERTGLQDGPVRHRSGRYALLSHSAHREILCSTLRIRSSSVFVRKMTNWMRYSSMSIQTRAWTAENLMNFPEGSAESHESKT